MKSEVVEIPNQRCYIGKLIKEVKDKGISKLYIKCDNNITIWLYNIGELRKNKKQQYFKACKGECYEYK